MRGVCRRLVVAVGLMAVAATAQLNLVGAWAGSAGGVPCQLELDAAGRYVFTLALPQGKTVLRGRYQLAGNVLDFAPDPGSGTPARYQLTPIDANNVALTDGLGQTTRLSRQSAATSPTAPLPRIALQPEGSFQPRLPLPAAAGGHLIFTRYVPCRMPLPGGEVLDTAFPKLFVLGGDLVEPQPFLAPADLVAVMQARWSPNYDRLAFISDYRTGVSACMQDAFAVRADGTGLRRITGNELHGAAPGGYGAVTGMLIDNTGAERLGAEGTVARSPSVIFVTAQGADGAVHPGAPGIGDVNNKETGEKMGTYRGYRFSLPKVAAGKAWLKVWSGKYDGNLVMIDVVANQVNDVGQVPLSESTILVSQPNLTPDGRHLVCLGSLASVAHNAPSVPLGADGQSPPAKMSMIGGIDSITVVSLATGAPVGLFEPLRAKLESANYPAVSPDGRWVAAACGPASRENLTLLGLEELLTNRAQPKVLVPGGMHPFEVPPRNVANGGPAWSPDGRLLAFCQSSLTTAVTGQICVVNADGTGARQLTHVGNNQLACQPCFSPDGRAVAFTVLTAQVGVLDLVQLVAGRNFTMDLWAVAVDGTGLRRLTSDGLSCEPAWGP